MPTIQDALKDIDSLHQRVHGWTWNELGEARRNKISEVVDKLVETHGGRISSGMSRFVVIADDYVYKVAFTRRGEMAIEKEASWNNPEVPMAAAEIIEEHEVEDDPENVWMSGPVKVLRMERVEPEDIDPWDYYTYRDKKDWPMWTSSYLGDGLQVGRTKAGELVLYDP